VPIQKIGQQPTSCLILCPLCGIAWNITGQSLNERSYTLLAFVDGLLRRAIRN
jgi:hypothetical protein